MTSYGNGIIFSVGISRLGIHFLFSAICYVYMFNWDFFNIAVTIVTRIIFFICFSFKKIFIFEFECLELFLFHIFKKKILSWSAVFPWIPWILIKLCRFYTICSKRQECVKLNCYLFLNFFGISLSFFLKTNCSLYKLWWPAIIFKQNLATLFHDLDICPWPDVKILFLLIFFLFFLMFFLTFVSKKRKSLANHQKIIQKLFCSNLKKYYNGTTTTVTKNNIISTLQRQIQFLLTFSGILTGLVTCYFIFHKWNKNRRSSCFLVKGLDVLGIFFCNL